MLVQCPPRNPIDGGPPCESNIVADRVEATVHQLPSSIVPLGQSAAASQGAYSNCQSSCYLGT